MSERCVDASIILKLVLKGEAYRAKARRLVRDSIANRITLIAPPFYECEVDTAIQRRVFEGKFTLAEASRAFSVLDRLPVLVMTHPALRLRARMIAEQFNQRTVYDSTYAALADLRGCEFWTADKPFYDAVKTGLPFVKYLSDYP
jgi:predicted nucleic acid-binding protein